MSCFMDYGNTRGRWLPKPRSDINHVVCIDFNNMSSAVVKQPVMAPSVVVENYICFKWFESGLKYLKLQKIQPYKL